MNFLLGVVFFIVAAALLLYGLRDIVRAAYAVGYERGRKDGDNWWLGTEKEVDQARQAIWKGGR